MVGAKNEYPFMRDLPTYITTTMSDRAAHKAASQQQ